MMRGRFALAMTLLACALMILPVSALSVGGSDGSGPGSREISAPPSFTPAAPTNGTAPTVDGFGSSISGTTVTLTTNNTHDLIFVFIDSGSVTFNSVTSDTAGNAWHLVEVLNDSVDDRGSSLYATEWSGRGVDTITFTAHSGPHVVALAIAGASLSDPLDWKSLTTAVGISVSTLSATATTHFPNELFLGFIGSTGGPAFTVGGGFNISVHTASGGGPALAAESQPVGYAQNLEMGFNITPAESVILMVGIGVISASNAVAGPVLTAAATNSTWAVLSWSAGYNDSALNYTVEYGTVYGTYTNRISEASSVFTASLSSLSPGTTYYIIVIVWAFYGVPAVDSNVVPLVTPSADSVTTLTGTATGTTTATLTWVNPSTPVVVNDTVAWGTTYGVFTSFASAGVVTHYGVTGLTANTTYYFEVAAWASGSMGLWSNIAPVHTLAYVQTVPILSAYAVSTTAVSLSWTAPANTTLTNYTAVWGTSYGTYTTGSHSLGGASTLDYTVAGLATNTTYWFEVLTWTGAAARGPVSNVVPAHTFANSIPVQTIPILSVYAVSTTSVSLAWTAPANTTLTNYTVVWGTVYGTYTTGSHSMGGTGTLTYTITGLSLNSTYWIEVLTWTGATTRGPVSNVAPAHTFANGVLVQTIPILSVSAVTTTAVVLTWAAPQNVSVTNYTVEWGTVFGTYSSSHSIGGSSTFTYTVTGLSLNTTYYFLVETWTGAATRGPNSNIAPARTLANGELVSTIPILSVDAVTQTAALLTWTAPQNVSVTNYTVEWGTAYGTYTGSHSLGGASTLTYLIPSLLYNTTYYFLVETWTGATARGPDSNIAPARTLPYDIVIPPVQTFPILSVVGVGENSVVLAWTTPQNVSVTNYTLEWGTAYGSYPNHVSEGASTFDTTVTGLNENTTYWFLIVTWTGALTTGPSSNPAPAQTLAFNPFVLPPFLSVVATGQTTVNITWTAPTNETVLNYTVVWEDYLGTYSYSAGISFLYEITGLPANSTVYVRVLTWTGAFVEGSVSNVAPAHTLAVPSVVVIQPVILYPVLTASAMTFSTGDYAYLNWTVPVNFTVVNYTLLQAPVDSWPIWSSSTSEGMNLNAEAYMLPCSTYLFEIEAWNAGGHFILSNPTPVSSGGCATVPSAGANTVLYTVLAIAVVAGVIAAVVVIRRHYTESMN